MINSYKNNCSLLINYSKIVVHWVCGSNCPNDSCSPLIANCKYLLNQLPFGSSSSTVTRRLTSVLTPM